MSNSIYNPKFQNSDLSHKIVFALDKISEYFKNSLREKGKEHKLSPIQIQILLFIDNHDEKHLTVNYISDEFNVTKATVSDSIKALEKKGIVKKIKNNKDSRSFTLELETKGRIIISDISSYPKALKKIIKQVPSQNQDLLWKELYYIINSLQSVGEINVQRMCNTCVYFASNNNQPYCNFLKKILEPNNLRLDCSEHKDNDNL